MARIVVIQGATASGKSRVAAEVARRLGVCVISADSRQFYREMSIGTAVATPQERQMAEHYFVQDRSVVDHLSAGGFETEALALIEKLSVGKGTDEVVAVVAGGSGLYVDALLNGLDPLPSDEKVRELLNAQLRSEGLQSLLDELRRLDSDYYNKVDRCNPQRVLRALEVCRVTGEKYSQQRSGAKVERPFEVTRVIIDRPREELYSRINMRVDQMVQEGLEAEVRGLVQYAELTPLKSVGYSEFFDYFNGKTTRSQAIELIKQHTRNYAKRQLTWLNRSADVERVHPDNIHSLGL